MAVGARRSTVCRSREENTQDKAIALDTQLEASPTPSGHLSRRLVACAGLWAARLPVQRTSTGTGGCWAAGSKSIAPNRSAAAAE